MAELTREDKENGALAALMQRTLSMRIPRAKAILAHLKDGEKISDPDLDYMTELIEAGQQQKPLLDAHPELHELSMKIVSLYEEIIALALENEGNGGREPGEPRP